MYLYVAAMIFNASKFKSSVSVAATPTATPIESTFKIKVQSHKIYDDDDDDIDDDGNDNRNSSREKNDIILV